MIQLWKHHGHLRSVDQVVTNKNPSKFVGISSDPTLSTARLSPSIVKVEEYPLNHELHIDPVSGSRFRS